MSLPTIAFLTALPLEFDAVVAHLPKSQTKQIGHKTYTLGEKDGYQIVVCQQHREGNEQAARETEWLIQHFQPAYLFFVGVAGGVKDVKLGEVVVARSARGYENVKVKDGVVYPRTDTVHSSPSLVGQAADLARSWQPKTQVNVIASGNKLISDKTLLEEIQQYCSDAVAVEMEAIGFLGSIQQHENVRGIVIRGISDLVVGKNAEDDVHWQPVAARNAAAFAFKMLDKLTPPPAQRNGLQWRKWKLSAVITVVIIGLGWSAIELKGCNLDIKQDVDEGTGVVNVGSGPVTINHNGEAND